MKEGPIHVSVPGTARRYGLHERTIDNYIRDEQMKELGFPQPIRIRKKRWFRLDDLIAFEKRFPEKFRVVEDVTVEA